MNQEQGGVARLTRRKRRAYYRFAETPVNGRGARGLRPRERLCVYCLKTKLPTSAMK